MSNVCYYFAEVKKIIANVANVYIRYRPVSPKLMKQMRDSGEAVPLYGRRVTLNDEVVDYHAILGNIVAYDDASPQYVEWGNLKFVFEHEQDFTTFVSSFRHAVITFVSKSPDHIAKLTASAGHSTKQAGKSAWGVSAGQLGSLALCGAAVGLVAWWLWRR
jgi:hypothetical protein